METENNILEKVSSTSNKEFICEINRSLSIPPRNWFTWLQWWRRLRNRRSIKAIGKFLYIVLASASGFVMASAIIVKVDVLRKNIMGTGS